MTSYADDSVAKDLLSKLALDATAVPHYTLQSGILRYRGLIWIGNDLVLQRRLITEFHSSAWGGHSGVPGSSA